VRPSEPKSDCAEDQPVSAESPSSLEHEVGYCKPPRQTRFKKGVSGNPKGRPKAKFNALQSIRDAISAPISATVRGRKKRMTRFDAFLQTLLNQMLKGDLTAARVYLSFYEKFGAMNIDNKGGGRWDELIAALEAGPVEPGFVHDGVDDPDEDLDD
jgi:hypothetical protein